MDSSRVLTEKTTGWVEDTWRKNSSQIYKLCLAWSSCKEAADDLFQEVALKFCKSASSLHLETPLWSWFRTVTLHTHCSLLRKKKQLMPLSSVCESSSPYDAFGARHAIHHHDDGRDRRMVDELEPFLKSLEPEQRFVVELIYLGGFTTADVCRFMSVSSSQLGKIRTSAMAKMRHMKNERDERMKMMDAPSILLEDLLTRYGEIS